MVTTKDKTLQKAFEEVITLLVAKNIGKKYAYDFREKKIRKKDILDMLINKMFEKNKGIIIFGDVGVGKTMDTVYIYKRILYRYVWNQVVALDDRGLLPTDSNEFLKDFVEWKARKLVSYYFSSKLFSSLHSMQSREIPDTQFVILDDFGREYIDPFSQAKFEELAENWYKNERTLIVTTNLSLTELKNRAGFIRVVDRFKEMCSIISIKGKSRRGNNGNKSKEKDEIER